jgi:ATP-dependent Lhr-like helicase
MLFQTNRFPMSLQKLHPRLQDFVKDQKWAGLTAIQTAAFDPIFQSESCIIEAPTSGGKTEAVLFPLLTRISANKQAGFKVLYIAPLKALLNDLALRVIPYAEKCYMEAFKWHGDVSQEDKLQQMIFPSDILLTTPESLEAILLRKANWPDVFRNLETIVIDEAHYFALTERGSHLVALLERIVAGIKKNPQRIAVTATIGNPGELLSWLMGKRQGGVRIQVTSVTEKGKDFKIHFFDNGSTNLEDHLYWLLSNKKSIVFERSRTKTEETATGINNRNLVTNTRFPVKVKTHHSSVSKRLREEAEGSIKQKTDSSLNAIISTSTLELGIDIGDLDQVVQIEGLNSSGSFLQRVGRTGRRDGRPQFFRGLCTIYEELPLLVGCVSLGLKHQSENILFPKKAFHIMAHQLICISLQQMGTTADNAWNILSNAYCFSQVTRAEFDSLIKHMVQEEYLRMVSGNILLTSDKTEQEFLRSNWRRLYAIFDTGPMYDVVDGKKIIGTLDSAFAREQELPFVFVLGGQEWNAIRIEHEMQQVVVEKNETGVAPKWFGLGGNDVPFELSQEVGRLLMNDEPLAFLDPPAQREMQRQRNTYSLLGWKHNTWILESSTKDITVIILWTFCGHKINRLITTLLSTKFKNNITYDYQSVAIEQLKKNPITPQEVRELIIQFNTSNDMELSHIIESNISPKWFSKFSECLPSNLANKTICEKGYDVSGLVRELKKVSIEY